MLQTNENDFFGIIGRSDIMCDLYEIITNVARVDVSVVIQGESGTGKEMVANAIHRLSQRSDKPIVPVNCAALSEGIMESELFGHLKGAFTGAHRDKKGRFEMAHGGTLFLDEIADMPQSLQAKVLRVVQERIFIPVGGEEPLKVDIRLISATNRNLRQEVDTGNFRDDLYYRLNVVPIDIPPLRTRKSDIPLLVEHFIDKASVNGLKKSTLTSDAMECIINYSWPGNIRELQSAVLYSLIKAKGSPVKASHLPFDLHRLKISSTAGPSSKKLDFDTVRKALSRSGGNCISTVLIR